MLSDLSVRRPVVAGVVAILLLLIGLVGFLNLSVREYPDTDPPIVSVSTVYTGAAALVVESRITQTLEERLAGIEGVETMSSRSSDGRSDITIEFRSGRDVDSAANDVRDRVAGAADDLPPEALAPEVRKVDADAQPIIFFAVRAPSWSRVKLSDYVDRVLVDRFSTIDGVAQINMVGQARPAMRIWLDADRLAAFRLTPGDIESSLRSQNVELPAGRVEASRQNISLRVDRQFKTEEDFRALIIGRGADGYLVRLGDVARVEQGPENPYTAFRYNRDIGVGLAVVRQSGANTLAVARAAKDLADQLRPDLPEGMTIEIGSDTSLFIDRAIREVWKTLAEAALLVVIVIFVFLGTWRATLIPAVTVPICLLASFAVLWAFGYSINLLTLLALVLAIGLVVDDAIVVLENVYRRVEEGEDPLVAAFLGTRQVAFAIISTTLVVCAVFVPVMFIEGQTGALFRELAVAMIAALALSGFLALTLAPMLCSKLLRTHEPGRFAARVQVVLGAVERRYERLLKAALDKPALVSAAIIGLLGSAAFLFTTLPSELVPPEDTGVIDVRLNAPEGTSFAALDDYARQAEALIGPMIGEGAVKGLITRVPGSFGAAEDFNSASMSLFLRPWEERTMTSAEVARSVTRELGKLTAVRGNATVRSSMSRGRGQPVGLVIAGAEYEGLAVARDRILAAARQNAGLVNLDADYVESKPQLLIDVDMQRAGDLGVSVDAVSQALQTLMGSRRVSTYVEGGEEYRVIVQAGASDRGSESRLGTMFVRGRGGDLVPLANLVSTREEASARERARFNKMRAITLQGGVAADYSLGRALDFLEEEARQAPEVLAIGYRGESHALRQTGSSIWVIFGLTIIIIYLLLAAQFESFIHPLVIVMTVPLAISGGVIGMALTGATLNLFSQIGLVMLVGLAAKNGILIVEFANQLRDEHIEFREALVSASVRRLRPILMTSIATAVGAVPLAIATGAGAGARSAIGTVIVFGVSIATLFTLFLIPILYDRLARRTKATSHVARRLQNMLAGGRVPVIEAAE